MIFIFLYIKEKINFMKQIDNYDDFKSKYGKSINEGFFGDLWTNIVQAYKTLKKKYGEHTWSAYNDKLKEEGKLPKGVEIFSTSTIKESIVNEDAVPLTHPDDNILDVDAVEMMEEIEDAYNFRLETGDLATLFIWGGPGIGKTEIVAQIADKLDIELIVFHLSQIEPTDFRGLPIILETEMTDDQKKNMSDEQKRLNDQTLKRSATALPLVFPTTNGENGKGGILFLDEMNLAPDLVLNAAMPLALSGKYDTYELPSKWIIISAGNRLEDVPDTDLAEIKGALANRFGHLNFVATVEAWSDWAKTKPYIDSQLIGFLNYSKEWFHTLEGDEEQSSAWPSPRSWSQASYEIWIKGRKSFNVSDSVIRRKYQKIVGVHATNAYLNYLKIIKVMSAADIEKIYKTGTGKKPPARLDISLAVLNAIAYFKTGQKLSEKEFKNIIKYIKTKLDNNFEVITPFLTALKMAHSDKELYCYYKEEEPLKSIYDDFVSEWYDLYNKMATGSDVNI